MNKNKKVGAITAILLSGLMVSSASAAIDPSGFVTAVSDSVTGVESVLTAGLAIVGGFFLWRVLKKALNRSA
jgi:hypothetical protein